MRATSMLAIAGFGLAGYFDEVSAQQADSVSGPHRGAPVTTAVDGARVADNTHLVSRDPDRRRRGDCRGLSRCSASCTTEVLPLDCGDEAVGDGEECDDGDPVTGGGCSICRLDGARQHRGR